MSPHPVAAPPVGNVGNVAIDAIDAIRLRCIAKSFSAPRGRLPGQRATASGSIEVLKDVTLQVRAGEILALLGSNGTGKTTLLEILATLQLPTSGGGVVGGYDLITQGDAVKRVVGYCPADSESFYPRLTGGANLEFIAALHGLSPLDARSRTEAVLDLIGARELEHVTFQRCSAGMKQKLCFARALLADPPILLLDEPTRSLDPESQRQFQDLLRHTLADQLGKTVVLVTHNLQEAERVCDRAALLRGGEIVGTWRVDEIVSRVGDEHDIVWAGDV